METVRILFGVVLCVFGFVIAVFALGQMRVVYSSRMTGKRDFWLAVMPAFIFAVGLTLVAVGVYALAEFPDLSSGQLANSLLPHARQPADVGCFLN